MLDLLDMALLITVGLALLVRPATLPVLVRAQTATRRRALAATGAYTARVLDTGVDSGRPYLAMELLDGRPLDAHLREQGPIRSAEALRAFALALAVALSGVHRLGLVHRDLKPAHIMLTTAGPRLLDFGIAAIGGAGGGPADAAGPVGRPRPDHPRLADARAVTDAPTHCARRR